MWCQNFSCMFFRFVTKHARDGQTDRQRELRSQDCACIAASRGKNYKIMLSETLICCKAATGIRNYTFEHCLNNIPNNEDTISLIHLLSQLIIIIIRCYQQMHICTDDHLYSIHLHWLRKYKNRPGYTRDIDHTFAHF